jgi:hypothetical protein
MSRPTALVIARRQESAAWAEALRAQGMDVIRADAREEGSERASPSVVVVSEKLRFAGALRTIRDLRKGPATREIPVVLVGVHPFTPIQQLRLGTAAPDATVPPGSSPEAVAAAADEARRKGRVAPPVLTPAQQAGLRYSRVGNLLMILGVVFSFPGLGPSGGAGGKAWFIELIPLGGLVSDIATGRVDGRKNLLSWQGWAAVVFLIAIAVALLVWPGFFHWADR